LQGGRSARAVADFHDIDNESFGMYVADDTIVAYTVFPQASKIAK
jgi:hypothetical protein